MTDDPVVTVLHKGEMVRMAWTADFADGGDVYSAHLVRLARLAVTYLRKDTGATARLIEITRDIVTVRGEGHRMDYHRIPMAAEADGREWRD